MHDQRRNGRERRYGQGRDARLTRELQSLDPGDRDPTYWFRFHQRVMSAVSRELARRRMLVELTVEEVLVSWSRTVVPAAVLAATVAGFVLLRTPDAVAVMPLAIEEQFVQGLEQEAIPGLVAPELGSEELILASLEIF